MTADFSYEACYEAVKYEVEVLHKDPEKEFKKALKRASTDPLFNKTMLDAYRNYILNNIAIEDN